MSQKKKKKNSSSYHTKAHAFCVYIIAAETGHPSDIYSASCLSKIAQVPEGRENKEEMQASMNSSPRAM